MPTIAERCQAILDRGVKPTVPEVRPIVRDYYATPNNGAGGSLHIVLDDNNVLDDHVRFCIDWAEKNGDPDGAALGRVLLLMSKTQRLKLGGVGDG